MLSFREDLKHSANGSSQRPVYQQGITGSIAFESVATNLVAGDNNGKQDIQNYWDLQVMGLRWYLYRLWQLM